MKIAAIYFEKIVQICFRYSANRHLTDKTILSNSRQKRSPILPNRFQTKKIADRKEKLFKFFCNFLQLFFAIIFCGAALYNIIIYIFFFPIILYMLYLYTAVFFYWFCSHLFRFNLLRTSVAAAMNDIEPWLAKRPSEK